MQKDHAAEIIRLYKEKELLKEKGKDYDRLKEKYAKLNSQNAAQTILEKTDVVKAASEEAGNKLGDEVVAKTGNSRNEVLQMCLRFAMDNLQVQMET